MKKIWLLPSILAGIGIASSASALTVFDSNATIIGTDTSRYEIDANITDGDVTGPIELFVEVSSDQKTFKPATVAKSSQKTVYDTRMISLNSDAQPQIEVKSSLGESLNTRVYFDWLANEDIGDRSTTIQTITLRLTLYEDGVSTKTPSKESLMRIPYGVWSRLVDEPIEKTVMDLGAYGTPKQVFAVADGAIYRSEDGLNDWEKAFSFSDSLFKSDMRFASSKDKIYAFANASLQSPGTLDGHMVAVSADGGQTWEEMGESQDGMVRDAVVFNDQVYIIVDYFKDNPMASGTYHQSKVFRSADDGTSWELVFEAPDNLSTTNYRLVDLAIFKNKIRVSLLGYYPTYKRQIKEGTLYSSASGDLNSWDASTLDHAFLFQHEGKLYAAKFKINHLTLATDGYLQGLKYTSDGEEWTTVNLAKWPKKIESITSVDKKIYIQHRIGYQDFLKKSSDGTSWELASGNSAGVPDLKFQAKLFVAKIYGAKKGPYVISK